MPRYFMPELATCPDCGLVWSTESAASLFPIATHERPAPVGCPACDGRRLAKTMRAIEHAAIDAVGRAHKSARRVGMGPLPGADQCRRALLQLSADLARIAAAAADGDALPAGDDTGGAARDAG